MKGKLFNQNISVILIILLIIGLFPQNLFSQPGIVSPLGEIKGFSGSVFDNHFSKADRELSPERWLAEAKSGIMQSIYAWELIAVKIYEDQNEFVEARNYIEKWSSEELEKRFSKWLLGRFFGEAVENAITDFLIKYDETQKNYSWHLDENGNIIFDDITGDPMIIRPNEEGREFSDDLLIWRKESADIISDIAESFDNVMIRLYPEILSYIPAELRETMGEILKSASSIKTSSIKFEFENLAAREESIFSSRRTRDVWSLRKKSEDQSARLFTDKLIAETEESCKKGIEELNEKIEQAAAGTGDLAILGEDWLRLYKEQFDRGLKAWEEAEERFFIRRIEWEQESFRLYSEGEESWLAAYNQFEDEKNKWELNVKELFIAGEMMFINLSEDFQKNIQEAKKEFELNMEMRIGEGASKIKAAIDLYLICASAALSAMENVQYWLSLFNAPNKADPKNSDFFGWLSGELKSKPDNKNLIEMQKSYNLYLSYMEKAVETRNRINSDFAELLGTGTLKDILLPDAASKDFSLDEYQIALIRAKTLVLYWERKTLIAEAVIKYADDLSAGRMTESEGIRAWEEAKSAYYDSLAVYETEMKKLYEAGEDIKRQQEVLFNLNITMLKEEEKLNLLNKEYTAIISNLAYNQSDFLLTEYNEKYNLLSIQYKKLITDGMESNYYDVLQYGMMWGIAEQNETGLNNIEYEEIWKNICNSLEQLFSRYDLYPGESYLPDINLLCEMIFNLSGNISDNIAGFILNFYDCFFMIPNWLDIEIENWINSFVKYAAVYAFNAGIVPEKNSSLLALEQEKLINEYNDFYYYAVYLYDKEELNEVDEEHITNTFMVLRKKILELNYISRLTHKWENVNFIVSGGDGKHWRQFLNDDYIFEKDLNIKNASSYIEGLLYDAQDIFLYYSNRVNDSLSIYSNREYFETQDNAVYFYSLYCDEYYKAAYMLDLLENKYMDIIEACKAYEVSIITPDEMEIIKKNIESEIMIQNSIYNAVLDRYLKEAQIFSEIGFLYDEQYKKMLDAYNNTDQKRFEYEKHDAIKRWASTAYLNSDDNELKTAEEKLARAQTVLDVLTDLYNNESGRAYNNPEYAEIYSAYEQSFNRKLLVLNAVNTVLTETAKEYANNISLYNDYQNEFKKFAYINNDFSFNSFVLRSEWSLNDIIAIKDGKIVFSRDSSMLLSGIDETKAEELNSFFNTTISPENEKYNISPYEESLRGLSQRMSGYFSDSGKFKQWSLARDYLITSLINANSDLGFLNDYYSGVGQLQSGGSLYSLRIKKNIWPGTDSLSPVVENHFYHSNAMRDAWNSLSETEKADLEFYVILTLSGNKDDYYSGFSLFYTYDVYNYAYNYTYSLYKEARNVTNKPFLFFISWAWFEMRDVNNEASKRIKTVLDETKKNYELWENGLKTNLSSIVKLATDYENSCQRIIALEGITSNIYKTGWAEIKLALVNTGKFNNDDISKIKSYWEIMNENSKTEFFNVADALTALLGWTYNEEEKIKSNLDKIWITDIQNQQRSDLILRGEIDAFINGTADIQALKSAAQNAYGNNAAAWKKHFSNLQTVMLDDFSLYMTQDLNAYQEFNRLGKELTSLAESALENRYTAEFEVRENEWNQTLSDIMNKYYAWQNSAALIIENGRTDWADSQKRMEQAYKQWSVNFQSEYERVSGEWQEAYLAGLEDKEKWLQIAASAADKAASDSFLSLIGDEGGRLSRFIDTREPFGIRGAQTQAQTLIADILASSGIANLSNALGSLSGVAGTASVIVKTGIGGTFSFDAAVIRATASGYARIINAEIADNEARKLAYNVNTYADEAVRNLTANVDSANRNFRKSMDDHFIFNGLWRRSGYNYVKDVIKGSTLFTPVITETVTITGYQNYTLEPIILKTNLDEKYIKNLSSIAVRGLLDNALNEINDIAVKVFGIGNEPEIISGRNSDRVQSPGMFGVHIGYSPDTRPPEEMGSNSSEIFFDKGKGELGRLITEYVYWQVIDTKGSAELSLAPWDKRMWNDEGSWIKSPSLRTVGTIAGSIAAGVMTGGAGFAGIALAAVAGSAGEIVFGSLDAAFGFKTIDEAAFGIGKSILTNTVSTMTSGFLGSAGNAAVNAASGTVNTIMTRTMMTGLQTFASGLTTNVIGGVTYSSGNGFGYSGEAFQTGINGVITNTLSSMAGVFTSSGLTAVNSGLDMEKLIGFKNLNKSDLQTLNNLLGSFASQGVNYAMGNDFTLNVLNLNIISKGKYQSGLLELNLGRGGVSMNLGTGGANVSFDNLSSALKGAAVWNVNNKIYNYGSKNDFDALIALRAQYGYGNDAQQSQLYDILNGGTILNAEAGGNYFAQTIIDENNRRTVNLTGYEKGMSAEDQFLLAVILGHEAYRDGIAAGDNYLETRSAVQAHTQMAIRMILGGESIAYDQTITNDMSSYLASLMVNDMSLFNSYIDGSYDSNADYWKLVTGADNMYNLEWDGKLEFDLSAIGRDRSISSLSDDDLAAIWEAGVNYSDNDTFRSAIGTFGVLNSAILEFEKAFVLAEKQAPLEDTFNDQWDIFEKALLAVGSSGLLAKIAENVLDIGDGQIFAAGGGWISSQSGVRLMFGEFKDHTALDFITGSNDYRLVAAMPGTLSIGYSTGGGLNLIINEGGNETIAYMHSDAASIRYFTELYATDGISMINGKLTDIAQNMVIGLMGNTGTNTTGAHVHFEYIVNKIKQDPGTFLDLSNYRYTSYALRMSGFSGTSGNVQLTADDISGILRYSSTDPDYKKFFPQNYYSIAKNSNVPALFINAYYAQQNNGVEINNILYRGELR